MSLAAKNALSYLALLVVVLGLSSYFLLRNSSDEIIKASEQHLIHNQELVSVRFNKYLQELQYDIAHLSNSPLIYQFLNEPTEKNKTLLNQEYRSILQSKPYIFQLRYIGIENSGREVIRVERGQQGILVTEEKDLQLKGERDYFKESISLEKGSVYVSKINLNREYGKISQPKIPTIRMAYPVYHQNRVQGILVINTDLNLLFDELNVLAGEKTNLSLIDDAGFYLLHHDESKEFEFEFDKPSSFIKEFNNLPENILADLGDKLGLQENNIFTLEKINYPREAYDLYVMLSSNKQVLLGGYYKWRNKSLIIIASFALLTFFIATLLMKKQVHELKSIAKNIDAFSKSAQPAQMNASRSDEIGMLAESFNQMSKKINSNITDLKKERDKAESAVKDKEEFIENMSHEIRNPIQSILGMSELMLKNEFLPHQKSLIENIRLSTFYLETLSNDILDYKNVIKGELKLNKTWNNLHEFISSVHKQFFYSALIKKQNLIVDFDKNLQGYQFYFDKTRLNQIFSNLIVNAIKYTEANGQILIKAECIKKLENSYIVELSVSDTGVGIDKTVLDKLENRYYRADEFENLKDSFGLGLTIVKGILDLKKSKLLIESEKDRGSCFSFQLTLPFRKTNGNKTVSESTEMFHDFGDTRLLVIEDDEQIINLYKEWLKPKFKNIFICRSIDELCRQGDFMADLCIMDARLNDDYTLHNLDKIKPVLKDSARIILVTAQSVDEHALPSNFEYIQKPFTYDQLFYKISQVSNEHNRSYQLPGFKNILNDYDGNKDKYFNALNLMQSEWTLMHSQLLTALNNSDASAINDIIHKIITTVRRLDLHDFEELLTAIRDSNSVKYPDYLKEIDSRFDWYLKQIEIEKAEYSV